MRFVSNGRTGRFACAADFPDCTVVAVPTLLNCVSVVDEQWRVHSSFAVLCVSVVGEQWRVHFSLYFVFLWLINSEKLISRYILCLVNSEMFIPHSLDFVFLWLVTSEMFIPHSLSLCFCAWWTMKNLLLGILCVSVVDEQWRVHSSLYFVFLSLINSEGFIPRYILWLMNSERFIPHSLYFVFLWLVNSERFIPRYILWLMNGKGFISHSLYFVFLWFCQGWRVILLYLCFVLLWFVKSKSSSLSSCAFVCLPKWRFKTCHWKQKQ